MFEFKLPDLGEGVHEGEILDWFVAPGKVIKEDDPLVEIETDKAAVTIPSPRAGTVVSITGGVGDTVAVGSVLVVIDEAADTNAVNSPVAPSAKEGAPAAPAMAAAPGAPVPTIAARAVAPSQPAPLAPIAATAPPRVAPAVTSAPKQPTAPAPTGLTAEPGARLAPVPAAPATRRLAREMGVDLRAVPGTGPAGRVSREDVLRFAETRAGSAASASQPDAATAQAAFEAGAAEVSKREDATLGSGSTGSGAGIPFFEVERLPDFEAWGPVEREALRSIRRKVAHRMVAAMTIVPHVAHMDECDVTALDAFRRELNARDAGIKYSLLPFIFKAVVSQLKRFPKLNASIDPHRMEIIYKRFYNVGFAADTPKGLVVPVVRGADGLSISEVALRANELGERARSGTLELPELQGGTFTITNLGSIGGTFVIPTINYPEVAILGLGRALDKPVVHEGAVAIRKMLPMTIAYDHRLVDGADAARFLNGVIQQLSDPPRLFVGA